MQGEKEIDWEEIDLPHQTRLCQQRKDYNKAKENGS